MSVMRRLKMTQERDVLTLCIFSWTYSTNAKSTVELSLNFLNFQLVFKNMI
jgi:hypothetical protein